METSLTDQEPKGRVYLLDTHGLVFQMFHGMPQMNAPDGRPTNAVFGVTRAIMELYDKGADYLIATFDSPGPTFRDEIVKDYKGQRPPPPDDLLAQEPLIYDVLEAMRIPILKLPGFEADDIIATLATDAEKLGHEVFLCTSDKDCRQLLSPRVHIQNLRKGVILDEAGLLADWGIRPEQVIDYQSLVGDSVDNIKGVPGCGAKTATKWLQAYGNLEGIIQNANSLGGPKLREALIQAANDGTLERCKRLVTLDRNVPIAIDWASWKRRDWDGQRLLELFQSYGFRGFANRVRQTLTTSGAKKNEQILESAGITATQEPTQKVDRKPVIPNPHQPTLFDLLNEEGEPTKQLPVDNWVGNYELVDTPDKFKRVLDQLTNQQRFTFNIQTTSQDVHSAEIVGFALCWQETHGFYVALRGPDGASVLDPQSTLKSLKPIFENPDILKSAHNIKFDQMILRTHGITLRGIAGDSMIANYLLSPAARSHLLDDLTQDQLNHANITRESLIGKGKKEVSIDRLAPTRVTEYACEQADASHRLAGTLEQKLVQKELKNLYETLEIPLIDVLAEIEYNGVRIDLPFLSKLSVQMAGQLDSIEREIHALAGHSFQITSLRQLQMVMFEELNLPVLKRTGIKGEPSTDQEVLEELASLGHELPKKLLIHRKVSKLKGTYVDALPAIVNPKTGRVHTSFNQTVATTGRLSSSDPNLQNIPARSDQGQEIRKAFIPPDGWQILTADYSQIELRFLAHFCGDEQLQSAFTNNQDIHALVAAKVFQVPQSEVTSDQRRAAKTVNFGVIYGISAVGLSIQLGIPRREAAKFIDEYFTKYPKVLNYQDQLLKRTRETGYIATILGRRRSFAPGSIRTRTTYQQRNQAEREAINMEIQGSAADLIKLAMLKIHQRMKRERMQSRMILSVHDELVFETPPDEAEALANMVRHEMTTAMSLNVPLRVDISIGPNWLDGEDVR